MLLTPEEIKVVKDFLAPAVKNGLLDGRRLNELLKLAASGGESRPEVPEKLTPCASFLTKNPFKL